MSDETPYPFDQPVVYLDDIPVGLPVARLEWFDRSPNRKIGSVNGHVVYVVQQWKALYIEFQIFHRLPVKQIDRTFKTSDEAKLFADTHLHRAMRALGFVAR